MVRGVVRTRGGSGPSLAARRLCVPRVLASCDDQFDREYAPEVGRDCGIIFVTPSPPIRPPSPLFRAVYEALRLPLEQAAAKYIAAAKPHS